MSVVYFADGNSYTTAAYGGESAGIDLYATTEVKVPAGGSASVPTGIRFALSANQAGRVLERGSITRTTLMVRAGVVDSGYTGEVFVAFYNYGDEPVSFFAGQRLPAQLVVVTIDNGFVNDQSEFIRMHHSSKRKDGKVGSSEA